MTSVLAFIIVIGILIVIHELGHFVVARLFGVGVERFSIGFGPVLWRYRGKETEYCLSAIPMGGYVKMMGDDENPLEGGAGPTVDPTKAFHGKSLIARFLIVFAGPGMNFVLAAVIFALVFMFVGRPALPPVVGRVAPDGAAAKVGLATGDKVVAVDGRPVKYWEDVLRSVQEGQGRAIELTVIGVPGGERKVTVTPTRLKERDIFGDEREVWDVGMGPYIAPVIGDTVSGFPAAEAGLRPGDTVVEIEGRPVLSWSDLAEAINRRPGQPTRLVVQRGTERVALTVTPRAVKDRGPDGKEAEVGRIGISPAPGTTYVRENPAPRAARRGAEDGGGHRADRHRPVEDRGGTARPLQHRRAHPDRAGGGGAGPAGAAEPGLLHRGDQREPGAAQPAAGAHARRRAPALLRVRGDPGPSAVAAKA